MSNPASWLAQFPPLQTSRLRRRIEFRTAPGSERARPHASPSLPPSPANIRPHCRRSSSTSAEARRSPAPPSAAFLILVNTKSKRTQQASHTSVGEERPSPSADVSRYRTHRRHPTIVNFPSQVAIARETQSGSRSPPLASLSGDTNPSLLVTPSPSVVDVHFRQRPDKRRIYKLPCLPLQACTVSSSAFLFSSSAPGSSKASPFLRFSSPLASRSGRQRPISPSPLLFSSAGNTPASPFLHFSSPLASRSGRRLLISPSPLLFSAASKTTAPPFQRCRP